MISKSRHHLRTRTRVGINGFGRIGRMGLRALLQRDHIAVIAINDLADAATLAHLLRYDSNYGRFPGTVACEGDSLVVAGNKIKTYAEQDPTYLPWQALQVMMKPPRQSSILEVQT